MERPWGHRAFLQVLSTAGVAATTKDVDPALGVENYVFAGVFCRVGNLILIETANFQCHQKTRLGFSLLF